MPHSKDHLYLLKIFIECPLKKKKEKKESAMTN